MNIISNYLKKLSNVYNYVNTTPRAAATLTRLIPLVTTIDVSDGSCRKGAGNPRVKRVNVYPLTDPDHPTPLV